MNYTLGLRGHDLAANFDDMCATAKEKGIKKLQFAMAKTVTDINFDEIGYNKEISLKINKQLKDFDLHISVLGCYIDPTADDESFLNSELLRFKHFLYYAKDFGADVVGTETGLKPTLEEAHSDANYQKVLKSFLPLVKEAEKIGVTIAIEPVYLGAIYSPECMRRLIDDINSDNLAVILDVSNLMAFELRHMQKDIIDKAFELFGDKIKVIHLKDFAFDGNRKIFSIIGKGELMTKYLFEKISSLKNMPEIILDETNVSLYEESINSLENLLK